MSPNVNLVSRNLTTLSIPVCICVIIFNGISFYKEDMKYTLGTIILFYFFWLQNLCTLTITKAGDLRVKRRNNCVDSLYAHIRTFM